MQKVLITGASGLIGGILYKRLAGQAERYDVYGLDRNPSPSERVDEKDVARVPADRFFHADLTDLPALTRSFPGMDAVVHLAANPDGNAAWESISRDNITGTYNAFEACRLAGVKRVVVASTIMTCMGYLKEEPYKSICEGREEDIPKEVPRLTRDSPPYPDTLYASGKLLSEALARTFSEKYGLSCLCVRIGAVNREDHPSPSLRSLWCSRRDIGQILERCIDAPQNIKYDLFYGMSDNPHLWVDLDHARAVLGYVPED